MFKKKKNPRAPPPFIALKKGGKQSMRVPTNGAVGAVRRSWPAPRCRPGVRLTPAVSRRGAGLGGSVQVAELLPAEDWSLRRLPRDLAVWVRAPSPVPVTGAGTWRSRAAAARAELAAGLGNPRPPPLIRP